MARYEYSGRSGKLAESSVSLQYLRVIGEKWKDVVVLQIALKMECVRCDDDDVITIIQPHDLKALE